jgi:hypothetical protein
MARRAYPVEVRSAAGRRPARGMDGVRWRPVWRRTMARRAHPAEGWSTAGRRRASDTGGREREEWWRLRTGDVGPDMGGRRLYGADTWQRCPGKADSGVVRGARWRRGSDAWALTWKGGD